MAYFGVGLSAGGPICGFKKSLRKMVGLSAEEYGMLKLYVYYTIFFIKFMLEFAVFNATVSTRKIFCVREQFLQRIQGRSKLFFMGVLKM